MTVKLPGTAPLTQNDGDSLRVSLKEFFEKLLDEKIGQAHARITHLEGNIEQARVGMEKRLDGMNEFRDTLRDQASRFASKNEVDQHFESRRLEIDNAIKALRTELLTKIEVNTGRLEDLKTFKDNMQGKASQASVNAAYVLTVISIIVAVASLVLKVVGK